MLNLVNYCTELLETYLSRSLVSNQDPSHLRYLFRETPSTVLYQTPCRLYTQPSPRTNSTRSHRVFYIISTDLNTYIISIVILWLYSLNAICVSWWARVDFFCCKNLDLGIYYKNIHSCSCSSSWNRCTYEKV